MRAIYFYQEKHGSGPGVLQDPCGDYGVWDKTVYGMYYILTCD